MERIFVLLFTIFLISTPVFGMTLQDKEQSLVHAVVRIDNGSGNGSGTMLRLDGNELWLATAYHVVENDSQPFWATFSGKVDVRVPVEIVNVSEDLDLALLKVHVFPGLKINMRPRCSTPLKKFEVVYSAGYAHGFPATLTRGFVADPEYFNPQLFPDEIAPTIIHTAQAAPGSSGGPVFALRDGQFCLAGINTAIFGGGGGGFFMSVTHHIVFASPIRFIDLLW